MGKIRVKLLGDEQAEKEQKLDAKKRREAKKEKKAMPAGRQAHTKGVGLKGGQQIAVVEGVELPAGLGESAEETKSEVKKKRERKTKVRSHRYQELTAFVDKKKLYPIKDAITLVKKTSTTRFDGSVEMHVSINPAVLTKEKASLSGMVVLPHGTGKKRRVVIVSDELLAEIEKGTFNFDVLVAHPSFMPKLAKHARVLGPKGLMPNPKNGTVTTDPDKRAKELEGGEVSWKTEPNNPLIHQIVGKVSFTEKQLLENLATLTKSIGTGKILRLSLNATMGPGIKVDPAGL